MPCAFYALLSALRGNMAFQSLIQDFPILGAVYILSYVVSLLCISSRFLCAIILHSYRGVRAEMYRPTIEPQDYEMIEFFVKRFKLWMGLSKTKEVSKGKILTVDQTGTCSAVLVSQHPGAKVPLALEERGVF